MMLSASGNLVSLLGSTFLAVGIALGLSLAGCSLVRTFRPVIRSNRGVAYLALISATLIVIVAAQAFLGYYDQLGDFSPERPEIVELIGAFSRSGTALSLMVVFLWPAWILVGLVRRRTRSTRKSDSAHPNGRGFPAIVLVLGTVVVFLVAAGVSPVPGEILFQRPTGRAPTAAALNSSAIFRAFVVLGAGLLVVAAAGAVAQKRNLVTASKFVGGALIGVLAISAVQAFDSVDFFDPIPERSLALSVGLAAVVVLTGAFLSIGALVLLWWGDYRTEAGELKTSTETSPSGVGVKRQ